MKAPKLKNKHIILVPNTQFSLTQQQTVWYGPKFAVYHRIKHTLNKYNTVIFLGIFEMLLWGTTLPNKEVTSVVYLTLRYTEKLLKVD